MFFEQLHPRPVEAPKQPVKALHADVDTTSASFLAEISVSSPQKSFISIIYNSIFWIKVSKKIFDLILKTEALLMLTLPVLLF